MPNIGESGSSQFSRVFFICVSCSCVHVVQSWHFSSCKGEKEGKKPGIHYISWNPSIFPTLYLLRRPGFVACYVFPSTSCAMTGTIISISWPDYTQEQFDRARFISIQFFASLSVCFQSQREMFFPICCIRLHLKSRRPGIFLTNPQAIVVDTNCN
jgi:hypothetical protein